MAILKNKTMKIFKTLLFLVLALSMHSKVSAETWNEPWQKEIIKNADYFVLAKVLSNVDSVGTEIEVIKYFGNQKLEGRLLINGFSLLKMTSSSGQGVHLDFEKDQTLYFLLNKRKDGHYAIATPTSGYAFLDSDKNVYATYRHSYHQALISQDIYEKTYTEIWNYYKTGKFDNDKILPFINEYIGKSPAGFGEDEISIFFLQHAAMETAYLLDMQIELERLKKFVESDNFHSRVSALQLLGNLETESVKDYLFGFILNEQNGNFEKVIAIWSLNRIGGEVYKKKLLDIVDKLSDEDTGFGGNLMDPRVGTHFPSPKSAVLGLR